MDPISQLFLQAQAPTGKSNSGFEAFVQGRQLAQRDRQLGMQQREQDALLQLRAQGEALQNQSTGLDIELKLDQMQREIDLKQSRVEAAKIMHDAVDNPQGYGIMKERIDSLVSRNPAIMTDELVGRPMMNNYRAFKQWDSLNAQAKKAGLEPSKATVDPKTGALTPAFENPDFRFDPLAQEKLDLRRRGLDQADIRSQLNAIGLTIRATEAGWKIENMPAVGITDSTMQGPPTQDQPAGPTLTPIPRPLTAANVTKQQETLSTSSIALREIRTVIPLISSETTGPIAATKGILIDRGLANIWPDLANQERMEASSVFSRIRASVIRALRSDSNINKDEVATLEAQVPSSEAFLTSPARAMTQIESIAEGIQERAIQAARQLNQVLPDDVLRSLDDKSMAKHHREKRLTDEEARRWFQFNQAQ